MSTIHRHMHTFNFVYLMGNFTVSGSFSHIFPITQQFDDTSSQHNRPTINQHNDGVHVLFYFLQFYIDIYMGPWKWSIGNQIQFSLCPTQKLWEKYNFVLALRIYIILNVRNILLHVCLCVPIKPIFSYSKHT